MPKKNSTPGDYCKKLLPGEHADIRKDAAELMDNPDAWLAAPNKIFNGRSPNELIGTEDEYMLRDVLRAIKYGQFA